MTAIVDRIQGRFWRLTFTQWRDRSADDADERNAYSISVSYEYLLEMNDGRSGVLSAAEVTELSVAAWADAREPEGVERLDLAVRRIAERFERA